jgi:Nitrogenase molybdenum-iron protein, alpha and beta chains
MSNLLKDLPGFATDFSGAASVLSSMGGLVAIHGPSGCMGNYTGFDEPDWFSSPGPVFSSLMREDEAILGLEDVIVDRITETCRKCKPSFIAIVGSPVPALIGVDYDGISREIEENTGIPTFGINTTGFDNYCDGMIQTLSVLGNRFLSAFPKVVSNTVNLLGYNNLDYCSDNDLFDLKALLLSEGWTINCITGRSNIEEIANIPNAECNLVLSSSALKFATSLRERYGTPFSCQLPIGGIGKVCSTSVNDTVPEEFSSNKRFLIIGDQVISNSLRSFVEGRYGCTGDISTFFEFSDTLARKGDVCLRGENDLYDTLNRGYDIIIADPLFRSFLSTQESFVSLPHPAVSSRLYWGSHIRMFDKTITELLDDTFTDSF